MSALASKTASRHSASRRSSDARTRFSSDSVACARRVMGSTPRKLETPLMV